MSKQPLIDQLDRAVTEILANPAATPSGVDASLADLLQLARQLREMPKPGFKARLRSQLERKMVMSTKTVQFRPGFRTVTPYVVAPDERFIEFAKRVFDAEETERTVTSPTSFHAELRIGDSMLMVGVGANRSVTADLLVYVPNADDVYQRALEAGAVSLEPMMVEHGDRFGCVQDPTGSQWCIATHLGKNYIPEGRHSLMPTFHPENGPKFIEFVQSAFSAQVLQRFDRSPGHVAWAMLQIGESFIGMSDPGNHEWTRPEPKMTYLYVQDADAVYAQAMRAGAQSIHPPADQFYGDRSGGVTDEWGNQWYMANPI
jgi:uncharacterized glyoxalase superfamily protein PhnB